MNDSLLTDLYLRERKMISRQIYGLKIKILNFTNICKQAYRN